MLNSEFRGIAGDDTDYYPIELRAEIDRINEFVYANVNNGVYRCGFAKSQAAYDEAFDKLFAALDELEARLARQRTLVGDQITEADWRLFPTLLRFDVVYFSLFKCNKKRIADYPALSRYMHMLLGGAGRRPDGQRALLRARLLFKYQCQSDRDHPARHAGRFRAGGEPHCGLTISSRALPTIRLHAESDIMICTQSNSAVALLADFNCQSIGTGSNACWPTRVKLL